MMIDEPRLQMMSEDDLDNRLEKLLNLIQMDRFAGMTS